MWTMECVCRRGSFRRGSSRLLFCRALILCHQDGGELLRSACLSVCLFANVSVHVTNSSVAVDRSSPDNIAYVMHFRFCVWRHVYHILPLNCSLSQSMLVARQPAETTVIDCVVPVSRLCRQQEKYWLRSLWLPNRAAIGKRSQTVAY